MIAVDDDVSRLGHLWLPLATFVVLALVFETTSLDLWVADYLYRAEGGAWALRRDPILRDWLHVEGRRAIGILYGSILVLCALSFARARLKAYRWGLVYLVAAISVSTLTVTFLKETTHVSCPWSVDRFGGDVTYVHTWQAIVTRVDGRCFPSGHAGSAYALLALYFFCGRYARAWRWYTFGAVIVVGGVFGIAQQARGAHYLSHDVWALAISWFVALAATPILFRDSSLRHVRVSR